MKRKATKKTKSRRRGKKPALQALAPGVSPISGTAPPAEHQFRPGESGNPKGRPTAGATIQEWINVLALPGMSEAKLRKIARDKNADWTKRAAAEQALSMVERGDLADFAPLLDGKKTMATLRKAGVNTELIKKFRVGESGVSIELHERAPSAFDRIMDRTLGKPTQPVDVSDKRDAAQMNDDELREACQRLGVPMPPGLQRNDDPQPDPAAKP